MIEYKFFAILKKLFKILRQFWKYLNFLKKFLVLLGGINQRYKSGHGQTWALWEPPPPTSR